MCILKYGINVIICIFTILKDTIRKWEIYRLYATFSKVTLNGREMKTTYHVVLN
jgi:hypothetical protein